jgi:hypothetical protein
MARHVLGKKNMRKYVALGKKSIRAISHLGKKSPEILDRLSKGLDKASQIANSVSDVASTAGYSKLSKTVLGGSKAAQFGSGVSKSSAKAIREGTAGDFQSASKTLQKTIIDSRDGNMGMFK